jgi:TRAP-type C4-dicarboxylate transport system permease small subunit
MRSKIAGFLLRIDKGLYLIESSLLLLTLSFVIVIAFLQVVFRNLLSTSIAWGDPLLRHLVLWIGFLGAGLATRENRHINIDALYRVLNPVWKNRIRSMTNVFSAFICALLARASFSFVRDEFQAKSTMYLEIPLWPFVSILFLGFVVITFRFLMKSIVPGHTDNSERGGA